jgi:hypothetical protein
MLPSNQNQDFRDTVASIRPGMVFVIIVFGALIAFEIFNYTTTDHALRDLLGDLTFAGIPWATILALAFCGIDFAGIARLFTPEQGADEPKEVWYLFGAWLLAATMNAILTWWGVSMAVVTHSVESSSIIDPSTLTSIVPVFVAVMVWVIRILIIGTLSLALDRLLHNAPAQRPVLQNSMNSPVGRAARQQTNAAPPTMNIPNSLTGSSYPQRPAVSRAATGRPASAGSRGASFSGADEDMDNGDTPSYNGGEPTYHSLGGARPNTNNRSGNDRFRRS